MKHVITGDLQRQMHSSWLTLQPRAAGMASEDRDMVTDLQIVTMAAQKQGLGGPSSPARQSLNAHRHEIYLDAVKAKSHLKTTGHGNEHSAQATVPEAEHLVRRQASAGSNGALKKGGLADPSGSRPGTGLSTARTAVRPNSAAAMFACESVTTLPRTS
eukprot:1624893-Rhodomonas_salina.1